MSINKENKQNIILSKNVINHNIIKSVFIEMSKNQVYEITMCILVCF